MLGREGICPGPLFLYPVLYQVLGDHPLHPDLKTVRQRRSRRWLEPGALLIFYAVVGALWWRIACLGVTKMSVWGSARAGKMPGGQRLVFEHRGQRLGVGLWVGSFTEAAHKIRN